MREPTSLTTILCTTLLLAACHDDPWQTRSFGQVIAAGDLSAPPDDAAAPTDGGICMDTDSGMMLAAAACAAQGSVQDTDGAPNPAIPGYTNSNDPFRGGCTISYTDNVCMKGKTIVMLDKCEKRTVVDGGTVWVADNQALHEAVGIRANGQTMTAANECAIGGSTSDSEYSSCDLECKQAQRALNLAQNGGNCQMVNDANCGGQTGRCVCNPAVQ